MSIVCSLHKYSLFITWNFIAYFVVPEQSQSHCTVTTVKRSRSCAVYWSPGKHLIWSNYTVTIDPLEYIRFDPDRQSLVLWWLSWLVSAPGDEDISGIVCRRILPSKPYWALPRSPLIHIFPNKVHKSGVLVPEYNIWPFRSPEDLGFEKLAHPQIRKFAPRSQFGAEQWITGYFRFSCRSDSDYIRVRSWQYLCQKRALFGNFLEI
jgi:hypothetical protein